ncbi:MAG: hypothetical protein L6Q35_13500, partial [Phycisphaerales bacterium]|nr:hypothetical protein [Phycisphaerales bacterium]
MPDLDAPGRHQLRAGGLGRGVALDRVADVGDLHPRGIIEHVADVGPPDEALDVMVAHVGAGHPAPVLAPATGGLGGVRVHDHEESPARVVPDRRRADEAGGELELVHQELLGHLDREAGGGLDFALVGVVIAADDREHEQHALGQGLRLRRVELRLADLCRQRLVLEHHDLQ